MRMSDQREAFEGELNNLCCRFLVEWDLPVPEMIAVLSESAISLLMETLGQDSTEEYDDDWI